MAQATIHRQAWHTFASVMMTETNPEDVVVIEMGAGEAIPTVRNQGNRLERLGATLIRINPRDFHGSNRTISIASGAKDALLAIDALIH